MDEKKRCSKCKKLKLKTDFNKSCQTKDGLRCECRDCSRKDNRRYLTDPSVRAKRKKYQKKYYSMEKVKEKQSILHKATYKRHPFKFLARKFMAKALLWGVIKRKPKCEKCKKKCITQGHHKDYTKPLDVIWLCVSCHGKAHKKYKDN